jgi:hypothetical protein
MAIANYQQMMTICEPAFVCNYILFTPRKLVAAINYLADNKTHGSTYAYMTVSERRIWLRTWLRRTTISGVALQQFA